MTSESHTASIDYRATIVVRSLICECDVVLEQYRTLIVYTASFIFSITCVIVTYTNKIQVTFEICWQQIKIFNFPLSLAKVQHCSRKFNAFLTFFSPTLFQGCFIKCEILQSRIISYRSLLFIAITMNDALSMFLINIRSRLTYVPIRPIYSLYHTKKY